MASLWKTKSMAMVSTNGQTAENTKAGGLRVSKMVTASILAAKRIRNMGYGSTESDSLGLTLVRLSL